MTKPNKKTTSRTWTIPFLVIITLLIVGLVVIRPWIQDVVDKRGLIEARKTQIQDLEAKLTQLSMQDEAGLQTYLLSLQVAVPDQSSPPLILATLEKAAVNQGVFVDSIAFNGLDLGESADLEQGGQITVSLMARAEYHEVVSFLDTLQQTNPLVLTTEFSIKSLAVAEVSRETNPDEDAGEDGNDKVVTSQLIYSGVAPYQNLPDSLGELDTEIQPLTPSDVDLITQLAKRTPLLTASFTGSNTEETVYSHGKDNPF